MSAAVVVLLLACTLIVGALIGSVGVGGVLLAPALAFLAGLDVHEAMGTSMCAFLFTGVTGTASFSRRGSLDWSAGGRLAVGAIPGVLAGAWANGLFSEEALKLMLAVLLIATGIYAVAGSREAAERRAPGAAALTAVGVAVGFGSGLTGTGGPVLAVPSLLLLGFPALATVAISQLAQLPIAGFGTLGFLLYGRVDLLLGAGLGLVASVGVLAGARIAHAVPAAMLRRGCAAACVAAGIAIGVAVAAG
jgi:uncharacterized protein